MAKLIDENSYPSTASILDLFTVPPTQVSFDQGYWQEIQLANSCTSQGPYRFIVQSDPHYLHLNRNYLCVKARIVKEDGQALGADDKVGPINLLGKTLFKQVVVLVNGKQAFDSGDLYAYRTYMETELNYSKEAKETILQAAGYAKDTPPDKVDQGENLGLASRANMFTLSQEVELMAPIHCDLFLSDRLIVSNTEVTVELHRNSNDFVLMSLTKDTGTAPATTVVKYKLEIKEMKLYIRKIKVMDSVHLGIESVLSRKPAKYPLRRVAMRSAFIAAGRQSVPTTPIFNGQLPRRLVIGFVEEDAFHGDIKKSPFVFKNHGVKSIHVDAGGTIYPRSVLKASFTTAQYTRAYIQMLEGLGVAQEDTSNDINMKDFKYCSCFFVFDLTAEEQDANHWHLMRDGTVIVHCEFASAVKAPGLEMIVYGEFDNLAILDRTRTIHFDYSV